MERDGETGWSELIYIERGHGWTSILHEGRYVSDR
jgi:hypothetical protein